MRNALVFLAVLFVGCQESIDSIKANEPKETEFVEPPEGVSFISAEYDGKKFDYVEGKKGVKSLGITYSHFSSNTLVVGLGETLKDSLSETSWTILFYFPKQELNQNVGNSAKLMTTGSYDFLLRDANYNLAGNRGTAVETITMTDSSSGLSNTTLIVQDNRPRTFTVKRVYFKSLTDNGLIPLIWLEGSFEGWMWDNRKVKGQFRIKTQPNV